MMDRGFVSLDDSEDVPGFVDLCRKLRLWERESKLTM
jgi:hypothetical protein